MTYYTHAGLFHADEVFGYAVCKLARVCENFERLTDINNIPEDGIIADIGREYNPKERKFDHHQGLLTRENGYHYASFGLLWEEYGKQVCRGIGVPEEHIDSVALKVAASLVIPIDAHDSDSQYKVKGESSAGEVNIITLPNVISCFNSEVVSDHESQMYMFTVVSNIAIDIIRYYVKKAAKQVEAKHKFKEVAIVKSNVIILTEGLPWKEIVHDEYPNALYVISPSNHPGNPWAMIAVTKDPQSRECKLPIQRPEWFTGFIHQGQWIAGANNIDELEQLAEYNIETVNIINP